MMAADRDTILSWLADLSAAIVIDSEDAADLTARIAVAPDLDAEAFANEALLMMRVIAESVDSPDDFDRLAQTVSATGATLDAISIMSGMALAVAGCRPAWPSRPAARRTRSRVAIAGDLAIDAVAQLGADGADLFAWLTSITAISCRIISDLAADAAPIVKASTGVSSAFDCSWLISSMAMPTALAAWWISQDQQHRLSCQPCSMHWPPDA
jgi:hypothetical protein